MNLNWRSESLLQSDRHQISKFPNCFRLNIKKALLLQWRMYGEKWGYVRGWSDRPPPFSSGEMKNYGEKLGKIELMGNNFFYQYTKSNIKLNTKKSIYFAESSS